MCVCVCVPCVCVCLRAAYAARALTKAAEPLCRLAPRKAAEPLYPRAMLCRLAPRKAAEPLYPRGHALSTQIATGRQIFSWMQ